MAALRDLDTWTLLLINRSLQNPLFDLLMPILSTKRYALLPAAVAILMLLVWGGRRMWVLVAVGVAAVVLSDLGTNLLKASLQRIRPCHVIPEIRLLSGCTRSFALPSNHAANMFAIAMVGWLGFRHWRWALAVLAAGVAYSRVYLGVHYPADVIVGALWGAAIGWMCTIAANFVWPRCLSGIGCRHRKNPPLVPINPERGSASDISAPLHTTPLPKGLDGKPIHAYGIALKDEERQPGRIPLT